MSFEDYGMRLEVRFWIADPMNGVNNVRSDVNRDDLARVQELRHQDSGGAARVPHAGRRASSCLSR